MEKQAPAVRRPTCATAMPSEPCWQGVAMLDAHAFRMFLDLLGELLVAQRDPDEPVECDSADGLLRIRLEPLDHDTQAYIQTALGTFSGRDHVLTVTPLGGAA